VRLSDVVAEELMLALPLAPRHEDEHCEASRSLTVEETQESETPQRPFANLAQLMGREPRQSDDSPERPGKAPRTRR
jgi:uncharacterized metal-binding protein YceD (DUF177 family)